MTSTSNGIRWSRLLPLAVAPAVLAAVLATGAVGSTPALAAPVLHRGSTTLAEAVGHEPSVVDAHALAAAKTAKPTPKSAAKAAPAPGIVITTPTDTDTVYFVHGPRTVTIAGSAPLGAVITLRDGYEKVLTTTSVDARGLFSATVTFSDAVSWDQLILIDGKAGSRTLGQRLVEVQFDAPDTEPPVITSPVAGATLEGEPTPFGGGRVFAIVSGTAKAGDVVFVDAERLDPGQDGYSGGAFATADGTGAWSAKLDLPPGTYSFTPLAQTVDDRGDPLSGYTDGQPAEPIDVSIVPGAVLPPTIDDPVTVTRTGDRFTATISGTGTPGSGVQLYIGDLTAADRYFSALYPGWFDDSTAAPSATVPAYDGSITVGADGRWSTALTVGPGQYGLGAFTVDTSDPAHLRYSVVGNYPDFDTADVPVPGSAAPPPTTSSPAPVTAAVAPAASPELASTGSTPVAPALVALAAATLGVSLVAAARRRRSSR
ncbi:hypothetical protein AS850_11035 [Frondihabitans sp. 762G35]|uniref:hypothetical protein n=1 Tax=Frondihabitans sp. 762G35 TaxID=1446794 RepID=UPI000D22176B|nr:hypothetical protein [Frondihabitans sp. 762G35]ARC57605.1 hypothetical protein AS850_11035 [Frondihabitans sp. 762G35]